VAAFVPIRASDRQSSVLFSVPPARLEETDRFWGDNRPPMLVSCAWTSRNIAFVRWMTSVETIAWLANLRQRPHLAPSQRGLREVKLGRNAHNGFTMFSTVGHALHSDALSIASAARVSLFCFLLPPVHAISRRYSILPRMHHPSGEPALRRGDVFQHGSQRPTTGQCYGESENH
jgi:hypothetical protein